MKRCFFLLLLVILVLISLTACHPARVPVSGETNTDVQLPGDDTDPDPGDPPSLDVSKLVFSAVQRIAYTQSTVMLLNDAGKETGTFFPAGRTVLVTGEADGWIRIRCGTAYYYLPTEAATDECPSAAVQASDACGGTVYPGDGRIVAIDPGHQAKSMRDKEPNGPGSSIMKAMLSSGTRGVSTKIYEYQLNLDVALLLRDELISRGYTVVMIRESNDVTLSNVQRAQIANKAKAGAFVRIHANGSENVDQVGAFTICQTKDNPYNRQLHAESYRLSASLLNGYIAATDMKKLSIWETDTMTGINWAEVPSTILEMGFMSNPQEDETMATAVFQHHAACGMADGLDRFFAEASDE